MKKILSIIIIIVLSTILGLAYNVSTNLSLRLLEATDDVRPLREDLNYNFELVDDIFDDVTLTEFSYLDGVTSAIQTQLDAIGSGAVDTSGTPVDNDIAVFTDLNTIEGLNYAELKAVLDLEIGTDVQAYDAGLLAIAGLTTAANRSIYTTAHDTYAVYTLTAFARTILDDADASTARGTLGIDLSLYYLKTAIDSLSEVESIYSKNITDSTELASALADYYLKTAIDTQGEVETIWGVSLANDGDSYLKTEMDSFSEIQAIISNKTLINEEDAITLDEMLTISYATPLILLHDSETDVGYYFLSCDTTESSGYGDFSIWRCTGTAGACTLGDNPPILWSDSALKVHFPKGIELGGATNYINVNDTGVLTLEGTANIEGVDATEMVYLSTVSSNVQDQIDGKEGTLTNEAGLYSALSDVSLFLEELKCDTTPEYGGAMDHNNERDTEVATIEFNGLYANGNSGATPTVDWQNGNYQSITISENALLTFSNVFVGTITLVMTYTTGDYTLGFDAGYTIHEEGGTEISFTETDGAIDILKVMYLGSANNFVVGAMLDVKD